MRVGCGCDPKNTSWPWRAVWRVSEVSSPLHLLPPITFGSYTRDWRLGSSHWESAWRPNHEQKRQTHPPSRPVRLRGTEKQHKPCEMRRYAKLLTFANSSPHKAFQRFGLRKTPMRKGLFCRDFCEERLRHKIIDTEAWRYLIARSLLDPAAIRHMPLFCSAQPHRPWNTEGKRLDHMIRWRFTRPRR